MANEYRVSQVAVEVLNNTPAAARVSLVAVEVLMSIPPPSVTTRRRMPIVN